MPPSILIILLFFAISLVGAALALAVRDYLVTRRKLINERLALPDPSPIARRREPRAPAGAPAPQGDWFERLVLTSGLPLSTEAAFLLSLLVGAILGGVLLLWREDWVLAACGMVIGVFTVILYMVIQRNRRARAFLEQLPEAVSLLSRSVHAGESLEQAMRTVAQHTPAPLAGEFRQCAMQFDMGLSVETAMRALTRRVPLAEMQILASTLIVQRRAGGHLAETLETLVRVIRDRLNYQRHFRATTAAARLSALLIGIGGPLVAFAIWTWQPQYLRLLTSSTEGRSLLTIAFILYLVGLLWAVRLLRPKY